MISSSTSPRRKVESFFNESGIGGYLTWFRASRPKFNLDGLYSSEVQVLSGLVGHPAKEPVGKGDIGIRDLSRFVVWGAEG